MLTKLSFDIKLHKLMPHIKFMLLYICIILLVASVTCTWPVEDCPICLDKVTILLHVLHTL